MPASEREDLGLEVEPERVDPTLLEFEQALYRREALVVVTSRRGRAHSSLVRTALARFEDAFLVVLVSAANAEPVIAIDQLLASSAEGGESGASDDKHAGLTRLATQASELGRPILIVVEDAERASVAQLERLRTALQMERGPVRTIQLVLVGSHKLVKKLRKREARGIWTRVTTHIDVRADAPDAHAALAEEDEITHAHESKRRSPFVAITSAGVLVAALLLVTALTRREDPHEVVAPARTTVQPARSVASPAPSANAVESPSVSASLPSGANAPMPSLAIPVQTVSPPVVEGVQESVPQAAPPGPQVTQYLGVETVRGTVPRKPDAPVASPGEPAATPPAPLKTGAQVVTVGANGASNAPLPPSASDTARLQKAPTAALIPMPPTVPAPAAPSAAESAKTSPPVAAPSAAVAPSVVASAANAAPPAAAASISKEPPAPSAQSAAGSSHEPQVTTAPVAAPNVSATPERATARAAAKQGVELQIAALSSAAKADSLKKSLLAEFPDVRVDEAVVAGTPYFRVRVGPFATAADASRAEERLRALGHTPVRYGGGKRAG